MQSNKLDIHTFNLNQSSLIEASAGTGKTFTITYLVLRLLLGTGDTRTAISQGALELRDILIVTFTRAATADLKARIRETIREARNCLLQRLEGKSMDDFPSPMKEIIQDCEQRDMLQDSVRLLQKAERSMDDAAICTIHSFCNTALNQIYAFEAGEAFETELITDESSYEDEALNQIWRQTFYTASDSSSILRTLGFCEPSSLIPYMRQLRRVRMSFKDADSVLTYSVRNSVLQRSRKRTAATMFAEFASALPEFWDIQCRMFAGALQTFAQACALEDLEALLDTAALLQDNKGKTKKLIKDAATYLQLMRTLLAAAEEDRLQLFAAASPTAGGDNFFLGNRGKDPYGALLYKDKVRGIERALLRFHQTATQVTAAIARMRRQCSFALAMAVLERVEKLKDQDKVMAFDDVLLRLDRALHDKEKGEVLARMIRQRYPVAMIDEFQDTDPLQFSVFARLYLQKTQTAGAYCYLIGDPKQSIYFFRGSDINSYLKAQHLIAELSRHKALYTLTTNYRSAGMLVESVNALFGTTLNPDNSNPFLSGDIVFNAVQSTPGKYRFNPDDQALSAGTEQPGCYVQVIDPQNEKGKGCNKTRLRELQAKACAVKILQVLQQGRLTSRDGTVREVRPKDIAVLVRSRTESDCIMQALAVHQINAVYFSDKSSVLTDEVMAGGERQSRISAAAAAMICLMEAVCDCANRRKVAKLLGSMLLAYDGAEFADRLQDEKFEAEVKLLFHVRQIWQRYGFLSAFTTWFEDPSHDGLRHVLSLKDGERRITNYYHIAEIIQGFHNKISGVQAQLRWFIQLTSDEAGLLDTGSEDIIKRLESEREMVQIRTIHNSKGLEFPLVFLPFMWSYGTNRNQDVAVTYYDDKLQRVTLDLDGSAYSRALFARSQEEEDVRLTYVALTRACAANFLFLAPFELQKNAKLHSLPRLLCGGSQERPAEDAVLTEQHVQMSGKEAFERALTALQRDSEHFVLQQVTASAIEGNTDLYAPPAENTDDLSVDTLPPDAISSDFSISSYTALTAGLHDRQAFKEGESSQETPAVAPPVSAGLSAFNFPRGTQAGLLLHSMLERCQFHLSHNPVYLEGLCYEFCIRRLSPVLHQWTFGDETAQIIALREWFTDIVQAPLHVCEDGTVLRLCELQEHDFIPEMHYLLSVGKVYTPFVNRMCKESAAQMLDMTVPANRALIDNLYLDERTVQGFITGSLDLVCRFRMADGSSRYYVLDYKSTWLGGAPESYTPRQVELSVFSNRNRYDVQYLFYTLALHRHLKTRLPDYDYERDFGGVLYLYLRGLQRAGAGAGQPSYGVFFTRPSFAVISRLDAAFGGFDGNGI